MYVLFFISDLQFWGPLMAHGTRLKHAHMYLLNHRTNLGRKGTCMKTRGLQLYYLLEAYGSSIVQQDVQRGGDIGRLYWGGVTIC